jgi:hypothetical protein
MRERSEFVDFDLILIVHLPYFLKVSIAILIFNIRYSFFAFIDDLLLDLDVP